MSKIDVVYTLAKAGYGKEEIAKLMDGGEGPAESAAPVVLEAPAAPAPHAAPKAPAVPAEPTAPAGTTSSHDELVALRNRLKVLETVLSVSNTDNVDSLASIVYPRGE